MSRELEQYLAPGLEIPWDSAAAFFVATKEATIIKTAAGITKEEVLEAKQKGLLSGIRSSTSADVASATKTQRQRGQNIGKEVGTLGGAAAGLLAGRKGGVAGKIGGTAIGALLGRGVGKTVGEEVDRARTLSRYSKEPIKKASIQRVRHLWKLAQGLENVGGTDANTNAAWDETMLQNHPPGENEMGATPIQPEVIEPSGAPTPEELEYGRAMSQLQEDLVLDSAAKDSELEHYRQVAEESQTQLQQMEQALASAQQAAQQAQEQAGMSQQQADMASQQLQGQSQADAQEKEQLNTESLEARDTIMKMRQAMQAYRESLQEIALQDPIAMAGPSPEEQGMEMEPPLSGESAKQMQEAQQAEDEAATQSAQAEQAAVGDQAKVEEQAAAEEQAAQEATKVSALRELWKEKRASEWKTRALGAAIGAAGGAGLQALTDRKSRGGMSEKERTLKSQLKHLESVKDPSVLEKHKKTITRALADTAQINREHPGSAAALAAASGGLAGAALAPAVKRLAAGLIKRR